MEDPVSPADVQQQMFTCLSCLIAFPTGETQREHYRSDHHRYNMKRRVAGLPPVSALIFNQKVLDKRAETALTTSDKGATCEICNKTYSTENAYRSHIISKRHRENELKAALRLSRSTPSEPTAPLTGEVASAPEASSASSSIPAVSDASPAPDSFDVPAASGSTLEVPETEDVDENEDEVSQTIEEKLAVARSRLGPQSCLFCSVHTSFPSVAANLEHMASKHSFFIPDADYLVDLPGLLTYLAEKIAVGNVCLHCNKDNFRTLDAVRKHMVDKSHCKIAYDRERDRLEVSDFYDFSSSWPTPARPDRGKRRTITSKALEEDEEWEDEDGEDGADGSVGDDESVYEVESDDEDDEDNIDEELPNSSLAYGDSPYELVLPSGARIGHRSMARYYKQSFAAPLPARRSIAGGASDDPDARDSGAALVRRLLADKNSALIPAKGGGYGAYGQGTMTVKARNRGEAKEAGRHMREFRDQKRREQFKTQVGFRHNHQKHFRDPLLQ